MKGYYTITRLVAYRRVKGVLSRILVYAAHRIIPAKHTGTVDIASGNNAYDG
ncbi:hypothetical protein [Candidatus Jettenia sp. AMX1]|uniref:hypothetical protein n=1 Tax=Candidatus Jettenia sp. AMX1 TaxID=2293637 RepID=UPI0002EF0B47|nr:hypothetical protein [Candidatus Jettenia sp. AMX1]WKZ16794.1 MAG: hypothetical protein QY317_05660 [Candidatus Jettenia caeni]